MWEVYFTSIIIILLSIALIKDLFKPSLTVFGALLALNLGNVISIDEAFSGFSNQGMLTIGMLFVVSGALQSSTAFASTIDGLLGQKTSRSIYYRLMLPVSFLSAFLNNTPIVAALIPVIKKWAKKHDLAASKFLIPLSYAAILGGVCTLIGTSTNLVIHGLLLDHGFEGFSFFELAKVGAPITIIGILYMALGGHRLLPTRKDTLKQFGEETREFVVTLKVEAEYPYIGKSIKDANLRHLKGVYLFQINRSQDEIAPVSPDEIIQSGDYLFFTGLPETIYELLKTPGLRLIEDHEFDIKQFDSDQLETYEAVVSNTSPLIGETVRDSGFRTKYGAVILGIHRGGRRINKKIGDIELAPNDTLFLLAKKDFDRRWYHSPEFSLISTSFTEYSKPRWKGNLALLVMGLMVTAVSTGLVKSMLLGASLAAVIMILAKIVSFYDAKNFVDFEVLIIIACAFGISKAIENSGLANIIADSLISVVGDLGPMGILAAFFFVTSAYTGFITNNAAAALMFPIGIAIANYLQLDPKPLMIIIAVAASASFVTPIGYQTNLMVYNSGGYRFRDFAKAGFILNLLVGILATILVYIYYF